MPATMNAQSLFGGGGPSTTVQPPQGTAKETVTTPGNGGRWASNMPGVQVVSGMPIPMLVALGLMAWYLFRVY